MAMKILEVPKSEREGLYGDFQSGFVKDAAVSGLDPNAPAAKRQAEEDWGGDMRAQSLFLKGAKLSQINRDHA
jgi:hypothetical protein